MRNGANAVQNAQVGPQPQKNMAEVSMLTRALNIKAVTKRKDKSVAKSILCVTF